MTRTLIVNTRTGKVHREDCAVLHNLSTGGMRWFTAWVGVARSTADQACGYCLPDGLPCICPDGYAGPRAHVDCPIHGIPRRHANG
jgi:hypothetical protein